MDCQKDIGVLATSTSRNRPALKELHLKFIDDMTIAKSLQLKTDLISNNDQIRPNQYRDRTGHKLGVRKEDEIKKNLSDIGVSAAANKMMINHNKTKVMLFNTSLKYDFLPRLNLESESFLESVEEHKLLGVTITSNLNWKSHIDNICCKAYTRMWMIRRLKKLGSNRDDLLAVYTTQIRSLLEFAVAVWSAGITVAQSAQLERVQKCALAIILSHQYVDYENALGITQIETLSTRRKQLCLRFARKASSHPKFKHWFCRSQTKPFNTRKPIDLFKPVISRTVRYERSPIAYLTKLLNET